MEQIYIKDCNNLYKLTLLAYLEFILVSFLRFIPYLSKPLDILRQGICLFYARIYQTEIKGNNHSFLHYLVKLTTLSFILTFKASLLQNGKANI